MISILGLTIVVLAAIGVVVYATMETFSSVERQASVVRNIQRLEQIASVLTSLQRVADVDGHMSLPMPEIENGKPVIPSWISVERRTPWGEPYRYCVFAEKQSEAGDGLLEGRRIAAAAVSFPVVGARNYVVRSERYPYFSAGLRAVIISGSPGSPLTPDCSSIAFDDGQWRVPGGMVRVVMEQVGGAFGLHAATPASGPTVVYVSNDQEIGAGGTGMSLADPVPFASALGVWSSGRFQNLTIRLLAGQGAYILSASQQDLTGPGSAEGRVLRLESADPNQVVQISLPSVTTRARLELARLQVQGGQSAVVRSGQLVLSGVVFSGAIQAIGGAVELRDSTIASFDGTDGSKLSVVRSVTGPIVVDGSEIAIGTSSALEVAGGAGIVARGSRLSISSENACGDAPYRMVLSGSDPSIVPAILLQGSELVIAGRDIAHVRDSGGQSPFMIDATSRVSVAPRNCGGSQQAPSLFEGAAAISNACAGAACVVVGPLVSSSPPYFDRVEQIAVCEAGAVCQVEAVCPARRQAERGECSVDQAAGGLIMLRRFGYGDGSRFFCEMVRPLDAVGAVRASAACRR